MPASALSALRTTSRLLFTPPGTKFILTVEAIPRNYYFMPPWYKQTPSSKEALGQANTHLQSARSTDDRRQAQKYCDKAKKMLERIVISKSFKDHDQIAAVYREHGKLLERLGLADVDEAQLSYKKADELSRVTDHKTPAPPVNADKTLSSLTSSTLVISISTPSSTSDSTRNKNTVIPTIFAKDCPPSAYTCAMPVQDERLVSTRQLTLCLALLQDASLPLDSFDSKVRAWLKATENNQEEKDRLRTLATNLVRALVRDELKDRMAITEVVFLAPVLGKSDFQSLLFLLVNVIKDSLLQNSHALEGLTYLIQNATSGNTEADDLVKILGLLSTRLQETFQESPQYIYESTIAVSRVLDAMVDCNVKGLDRVKLHEPLFSYLHRLESDKDPYMVYQAAYAYQALLCVPDDEEPWQAALRRSGAVIKGVGGLASAIKSLNVADFINGLSSIQEGFQGAGQIIGLAVDAYNGVTELKESGQGLLESLKSGLSFSHKRAWYAVLRGADSLIQNGELAKFKTLILDAPCRLDLAFQWGLCQRLERLAEDPAQDDSTQKDAIAFLGEIYWNDKEWGQKPRIKQYILDILLRLSHVPENGTKGSMNIAAESLLEDLKADGNEDKQNLYKACIQVGPSPLSWKAVIPFPDSTSLIDLVQNKTQVEPALRKYRYHRLKDHEERRPPVYISPQAKATRQSLNDDLFDLATKVNEFIASGGDSRVFLILGDSGAGKSTFNLELERNLWRVYETDKTWIPLFISLPSFDKPEKDLVTKHLQTSGFTEDQIRELKSSHKFILICDGYDECQNLNNLYNDNRLNTSGEWIAKMVISCRSEFLGLDYRAFFQPGDRKNRRGAMLLQEAVIAPFTVTKISEYIQSYVDSYKSGDVVWKVEDYDKTIKNIPNLLELVRNPLLLSLALEVLPKKIDLSKDLTSCKMSRVTLYDQFVEDWIEKGKMRLTRKLTEDDKEAFRNLSEYSFVKIAIEFMKDLAVAIFDHHDGKPVVEFSPIRDKESGSWKNTFFGTGDGKNLLRQACPLKRTVNKHQFIHLSVLEYGLARAVFEPGLSWEESDGSVEELDVQQEIDQEGPSDDILSFSPLFRRNFVNESSIINFLSERVQQRNEFKAQLHQFIDRSKTDDRFSQAAANAITILVRAGVRFNGEDLRNIRVPGADLSCGDFDSAQLQGADLRNTTLRSVWMHQADLSNSHMEGAKFHEYPYIDVENIVQSCAFSPDGKHLAVGLLNGSIVVYCTVAWNKVFFPGQTVGIASDTDLPSGQQIYSGSNDNVTRLLDAQTNAPTSSLSGHTKIVTSVVYSPSGHQIASGSHDNTVRLWDAQTGSLVSSLSGHAYWVTSVVYSPRGHQIASGSQDNTVRLWDTQTGSLVFTLNGHDGSVNSVAYSPNGEQIASASWDKTVRVWDAHTGAAIFSLSGHTSNVISVAYSPSGHQIASGGWDTTVQLWDSRTGAVTCSLTGHSKGVTSVAYSPDGQQIVSGSNDKTVRLWDAKTGVLTTSLSSHTDNVTSVTFSPSGHQIASGSRDKTVRLWDAHASPLVSSYRGHTGGVTSVACAPSGREIASGSWDNTVLLWDVQTGATVSPLIGHTNIVRSVAYSPSGHQIASGSEDRTVRLWDSQTGAFSSSLSGHYDSVTSVAYSPNGHQIASGGEDYDVRLWDAQTGTPVFTLNGHNGSVNSVAYSPSGHQIASGSWDKTVRVWDAHTGAAIFSLSGHTENVTSVAYSPSGHQIASGSDDTTARLWDSQTGFFSSSLSGHNDSVTSISYSPNGHQIASGSYDKTVRLWDIFSGQCLFILDGFQDVAMSVAWKAALGDIYLSIGSKNMSVHMWKVSEDGKDLRVCLHWRSTPDRLVLLKTSIQGVEDLSDMNIQLFQQQHAVGRAVAL